MSGQRTKACEDEFELAESGRGAEYLLDLAFNHGSLLTTDVLALEELPVKHPDPWRVFQRLE